ncbi:MAG: hypothetical protein ACT4NU_09430, partial [Chromatiales bacterium]
MQSEHPDTRIDHGLRAKEPLIKSEVPAAQGCAAIFDGGKPLKMKHRKNQAFCFACSENSRMGLFRASLMAQRTDTRQATSAKCGAEPSIMGSSIGVVLLW